MSISSSEVRIVQWQDEAPALSAIRKAVFIEEQHVPEELEWDEFDPVSIHALAVNPFGAPVGTARLLPDGHIGRMAVLKAWRGRGIGSAMLQRLLDEARHRGVSEVILNAQITAAAFYAKFGFQTSGNEFMEAGIPHVKMFLKL
ncbi:MAG: GNAT family N-acetyltransferase [Burkholderiales bacterium]|nr:GNAT family N-acetyltransferase [Nitrosomonas sp.]MCP5276008.1 GNAT family N-acetyltransferase [Burkholderiales bacterium]